MRAHAGAVEEKASDIQERMEWGEDNRAITSNDGVECPRGGEKKYLKLNQNNYKKIKIKKAYLKKKEQPERTKSALKISEKYHKEDRKFLEKEEEWELARAWRERRDKKSRDRLVLAHRPMLRSMARRLAKYGQSVEDLVQDGMVGLLLASESFDPEKGVRFSSFARNYALEDMAKKVRDLRGPVRVPLSSIDRAALPLFQKATWEMKHGQPLTEEGLKEVAFEIGVSHRTATKLFDWLSPRVDYLDAADPSGKPSALCAVAFEGASTEEIVAEREGFDLVMAGLANAVRALSDRHKAVGSV